MLINYWQAGYEEIPLDCGCLVTEIKTEEWLKKVYPRTYRKKMYFHYCRGDNWKNFRWRPWGFFNEIMMAFPQRPFMFRWSDTCLRWVDRCSPEGSEEHLWILSHCNSRAWSSSFCLLSWSALRVPVSTGNEDLSFSTRTLFQACSPTEQVRIHPHV